MLRLRTLMVALLGLAAGPARADVPVRVVGSRAQVHQILYEVNPQLGRAWIDIVMIQDRDAVGDQPGFGPTPTITPGLSYDRQTRQIVFAESGRPPVVCARVVPKRFLFVKWDKIEESGRCGVTRIVDEAVSHDDGFWVSSARQRMIYFGRTR